MKRTFKIEIEVDEKKVREQYPNFRSNFTSTKSFIDFLLASIPQQKTNEFGYTLKVKR